MRRKVPLTSFTEMIVDLGKCNSDDNRAVWKNDIPISSEKNILSVRGASYQLISTFLLLNVYFSTLFN
jgi:hypothetical protein